MTRGPTLGGLAGVPIDIGTTRLRNRIMTTAHTLLYGDDGLISDRHLAYYAERARGGIGLLMTEQHAVDPFSLGAYRGQCVAYDPRCVDRFAALAEAVHAHGAAQFVQLFATGAQGSGTGAPGLEDWAPVRGPSTVPTASYRETPFAMDHDDIAALRRAFADSAANVVAGGLDGIEVHAAHAYLLGQFLSPVYNRRTDAYGGSPQARTRLVVEVLDAIRERIGDAVPVGIRFGFHEYMGDAGITPETAEEQLSTILDTGLLDFVDVSAGTYHTNRFGHELDRTSPGAMGVMDTPGGFNLAYAARAREIAAGRAAVLTVGGMRDLDAVEKALADGDADVIGMTRAHLADPHLVRKHAEGRGDEVVSCMAANECTNRLVLGREVTCVVNPTVGREAYWPQTPPRARRAEQIVVVGGGPAGMRFAATAAGRGHDVTLVERSAELGGHLGVLARLPGRGRWAVGVADMVRALSRTGVRVETDRAADADDLVGADRIVVAVGATWDVTGSSILRPDRERLPGVGDAVALGLDVLGFDDAVRRTDDDPRALGARVVLVDETSGFPPLGLALRLARAGVRVDVVSPFTVGEHAVRTMDAKTHFPTLIELGVGMRSGIAVQELATRSVAVRGIWGGPVESLADVDAVVFSTSRTPAVLGLDAVLDLPGAVLLGDARAPRTTVEVVAEAEAMARADDRAGTERDVTRL